MNPNENSDPQAEELFKTGTTLSEPPPWFGSLLKQITEMWNEKKNPQPQVEITAQRDPSALNSLVDMPSPLTTLVSDVREAIHDHFHPRKIETTAEMVEVEEIWSKPKTRMPRLLSVLVHVALVTLALVPWATSIPKLTKPNGTGARSPSIWAEQRFRSGFDQASASEPKETAAAFGHANRPGNG